MQKNVTQLHGLDPQELLTPLEGLKIQLEDLKKSLQSTAQKIWLTRQDVADMFSVGLATVHNWTRKGTLVSYGMNGRVYYLATEVNEALIKLN